jgi:hypothetical protein
MAGLIVSRFSASFGINYTRLHGIERSFRGISYHLSFIVSIRPELLGRGNSTPVGGFTSGISELLSSGL